MYFWRITKYKPGTNADEWTSVSDVGKVYDGKVFEWKEYLRIENLYLNAIQLIAKLNMVSFFEISNLELLQDPGILPYNITDHSTVNLESALAISQKVLREELWCKLLHNKMIIHFGYDYYMYIGSAQHSSSVLKKILDMGLFVEEKLSPYFCNEDIRF